MKDFENVYKIKDNSDNFFLQNNNKFEVIYIDGSHLSSQVYKDCLNAWSVLQTNGFLICDDYIWSHYKKIEEKLRQLELVTDIPKNTLQVDLFLKMLSVLDHHCHHLRWYLCLRYLQNMLAFIFPTEAVLLIVAKEILSQTFRISYYLFHIKLNSSATDSTFCVLNI